MRADPDYSDSDINPIGWELFAPIGRRHSHDELNHTETRYYFILRSISCQVLDDILQTRPRVTLRSKRSAEELVAEDWGAVSRAIIARMTELPMNQRQLIDRSGVSRAIVREIQHNTVQRGRSDRTLAALSAALGWHAQHLHAVLNGYPVPRVGDPVVHSDKDVPSRLTAIEHELRRVNDQLERLGLQNDQLSGIVTNIRDTLSSS